jgi:excinuclease UvrABC ATPase subunit
VRDPVRIPFLTAKILKEVHDRLGFVAPVGLDCLTLDRT